MFFFELYCSKGVSYYFFFSFFTIHARSKWLYLIGSLVLCVGNILKFKVAVLLTAIRLNSLQLDFCKGKKKLEKKIERFYPLQQLVFLQ